MPSTDFPAIKNGGTLPCADLRLLSFRRFRQTVIDAVEAGARLSALPVWRPRADGGLRMVAVLSRPVSADIALLACDLPDRWPSLTPDCPAAHWFEREIAEKWGVVPEGHPWLKPIRFEPSSYPMPGKSGRASIGEADFLEMTGGESHEVAVGPVHAGVIEPGHFRFLCHGETVYHLEISLGYQHRGVECAMIGGPWPRSIHHMETLAGDTTVGHATAYCRAVESLSATTAPPRAEAIRAIAAELERIANHIGDLGALSGDVGFLPTMSYCGRIRGDALNLTALICGNRFGRGLVRPGGVDWDLDPETAVLLATRMEAVERDAAGAVELMFDTPSVLTRFNGAGVLSATRAVEIGLVGVAARACGLERDVRREFPYGMYSFAQVGSGAWGSGDCFARAYVRWLEVQASLDFIRHELRELPAGDLRREAGPLRPDQMTVSLVEGWRGEICHVAATDDQGRFAFYKVVDPSFHNWFGLALALRGQQISDFPLCNKSFNLSYCGHDL